MEEKEVVSRGFSSFDRSDSKILGEKRRSSGELEDRHDVRHEIRNLGPMLDSEPSNHDSKDVGIRDSSKRLILGGKAMSEVAEVSQRLDKEAFALRNENEMSDLEAKPSLRQLDLNTDVCLANDSASNDCEKQLLLGKQDNDCPIQRGLGLDLNADAVSSSVNDDSSVCFLRRHGRHGSTKPRDNFSECGSSNVPAVGEKDPMKLWKAMKQNGFLSHPHGGISAASSCYVLSSHGGIPAPRKRGRKSKNDPMKRKIDIARKEEVDKFARLAAPSGLLNNLNPGIINHVRNKKQVLSIIENLVKSEQDTINFHRSQMRSSKLAIGGSRRNLGVVHANGPGSGCSQEFKGFMPMDTHTTRNYEQKHRDGDLSMVDAINEGLKIPTSANVSENFSSLSAEESMDFSSASVLTVKAATVASQWLELLHQDIRGRLSALRRSRKRVRAVITTELPFLMLKEFPSNQENDPTVLDGVLNSSKADMHKARWSALFNQMDQTLSEEEKQLESWLTQVRELQLHCDQGLQHLSLSSGQNFLQLGVPEDSRSADTLSSDKELAVRAAAASIYSTCNFLISKENVTCT